MVECQCKDKHGGQLAIQQSGGAESLYGSYWDKQQLLPSSVSSSRCH
jgi:hypothetical protein